MDPKSDKRPIVIKRIKKSEHGHHGGAWKIAYADFVTAMMAFFLLMWLLNSLEKNKLQGISAYFKTPLNMSAKGGAGAGEKELIAGKGGGDQASNKPGLAKMTDNLVTQKSIQNQSAAAQHEEAQEKKAMENLKENLEQAIDSNPTLKQYKNQLLVEVTDDGLKVQILDEKNRPMFDLGGDTLKPYTKDILHEIGKTLNKVPNKITITGHTDAMPYSGDANGFSNWELSANRANTSRRELIAGGMDENKVLRVVGLASTNLLDKSDPNNPINRRISIVVMNKKTEDEVANQGY